MDIGFEMILRMIKSERFYYNNANTVFFQTDYQSEVTGFMKIGRRLTLFYLWIY